MHSVETINKFLALRAQGMSLARIAKKIGVSERTLYDWNRTHAEELRSLRAIELEALNEKLLATREHELTWLTAMLEKAEESLLDREFKYQSMADVWRILTYLRAEVDKRRNEPDLLLTAARDTTPPPPATTDTSKAAPATDPSLLPPNSESAATTPTAHPRETDPCTPS